MASCHACGNDYDKTFEVAIDGKSFTFDCFECAIQTLAPTCSNCGTKILGHGLEKNGTFYCCAQCARKQGVSALQDRI